MKIKHWTVLAVGLMMGLDGPSLRSQEPTPATSPETIPLPVETEAVPAPAAPPATPPATAPAPASSSPTTPGKLAAVKGDRVNVRGRARLKSEVITQLNKGDQVVVLEQVPGTSAEPGEPTTWARILLPRDTPVWVHASFVDPATRAVTADRLNMRGGPGENHSVLGQIEKGTIVEVRETKGNWIKISAPPEAGAYVASFLLDYSNVTPPSVATTTPTPTTTPAPPITPAPAVQPEPTPPADPAAGDLPPPTIPVEIVEVEPAETATPPPVEVEPELIGEFDEELPPEVMVIDLADPGFDEPEVVEPEPELVKRVVRREGVVDRTTSIQAPTYFRLHNVHNRRLINYLHSTDPNIVLKDFFGARVIVSGEEMLDERWPNTPVINVETLQTVP